jgi:hypothetical protein
MLEGYRKTPRPLGGASISLAGNVPAGRWTAGSGSYFLAGTILADSARTLGGLLALPGGEWAPEVSSGFCSGGV